MRPNDHDRGARNRVGLQLDRASVRDSNSDRGLARAADGRFEVGEIARWAGRKYGHQRFADLPRKPRLLPFSGSETVGVRASADPECLPGTLAECHDRVLELLALVEELRQEKIRARRQHVLELSARFDKA